jgi:ribosome recycling factor
MSNEIITLTSIENTVSDAMAKAFAALQKKLESLHTGRASPALLANIQVPQVGGGHTRLGYVANIAALDAHTLKVIPFDTTQVTSIAKALGDSTLKLTPTIGKTEIIVPLPALSIQRRKDTARLVQQMQEESCIEMRNHRQWGKKQCETMVKDKSISEDDERRSLKRLDAFAKDYVKRAEDLCVEKEKQIMAV